jgi:two-component system KDP operon response regulator KdpE
LTAILFVDGGHKSSTGLSQALRGAAYEVARAVDGLEALRLFYQTHPGAVLIGTPVPKLEALELVHLLRAISTVPILVLVEKPSSSATVRALDAGADDVIDRATSEEEIMARVRASLRRSSVTLPVSYDETVLRTGDILVDRTSRTVVKRGSVVSLTQTEFRLLDALASRLGQVAPHRFLLSTVWGDAFVEDTHYLRMYIGYLRLKLEDDPTKPKYLKNEWGVGYRLAAIPFTSGPLEPSDLPAYAVVTGLTPT